MEGGGTRKVDRTTKGLAVAGKTATPEQIADAVALRAAGLSLVGIAERVGLSVSTVQRVLRKHPTAKGAAKIALIESAKHELLQRVTNDTVIREEMSRLIADDLHHAALLRRKAAMAGEHLDVASLRDAAVAMRALAAWSVVVKNTSDVVRRVMRFDKAAPDTNDDLPELVVRELSVEEIERVRGADRVDHLDDDTAVTKS